VEHSLRRAKILLREGKSGTEKGRGFHWMGRKDPAKAKAPGNIKRGRRLFFQSLGAREISEEEAMLSTGEKGKNP